MKEKSLFAIVAVFALGACTSQDNINAYMNLDPYQRTMAVSAPAGDLTLRVENVLQNNDIQIGAGQQPVRNPRYSLQLTYSENNICFPNLDPKYDYDLVITDLRMGGHVFAMHGTDCRHTILDHLDAYIKNRPM